MRFPPRLWFLPLLVVAALVALLQGFRLQRVLELTALPQWSVDAPARDAASPTGYAGGWRQLIVDDTGGQSQQWIAQAQLTLAGKHARIDHVDYDNAPFGRENHLPMPYRLWLAGLAWLERALTGTPAGIAVEHAALYADLLLQVLCGVALLGYVSREFGRGAGVVAAVGWFTLFPLATNFLPGTPQSQGLSEICVLWSLLPLAAALANGKTNPARSFFLAGLAGGIGLGFNLNTQLTVIAGVALGAIGQASFARRNAPGSALPWRWWGWGGGLASLAVYGLQYFPDNVSLRFEGNHPLYAVGWIALGSGLGPLTTWLARPGTRPTRGEILTALLAWAGFIAVVGFIVSRHPPLLTLDITATRLTRVNGGAAAEDFGRWLTLEGGSARMWATLLPAALLMAGVVAVIVRPGAAAKRGALALLAGPLLVAVAGGFFLLRWWNTFDSVALAAVATVLAGRRAADAWGWIAGAAAAVVLGLVQLVPPRATFHAGEFDAAEMQAVLERDLAQWIAQRRPDATVLAPPALTTSLWYYGGTRGVTTFDADNRDGLMGALRVAAAPTAQEAQVLLTGRNVSHVVLPSWDRGLDESAKEISGSAKSLFIDQLREWMLPASMRPVAYYLPPIEGFGQRSAVVFEYVDPESDAVLVSRLSTYFLEAGLPGHASEFRKFVRRFPQDLGALVTLAEIERVRGDEDAFTAAVAALDAPLAAKADRRITWERRIALAVVLAQGGRGEAAREQARRCFAEADEASLRELSPKSLYRLLALGRTYGLEVADPKLRELALHWLPPDFRSQLQQ